MDCFGTYFTLYTCPNLQCNSCSQCYGTDCFGTYFTHVQTCNATRVHSATERTASVHTLHFTRVQTCNVTRVDSATEWTDSVHTLHMSQPVMQRVFTLLRNGLIRNALKKRPAPARPYGTMDRCFLYPIVCSNNMLGFPTRPKTLINFRP